MPAQSKLECAFICKKDEMCGIANYDNLNSMCEFVPEGMGVSYIVEDTTEKWEVLGKNIHNKSINNLKKKVIMKMIILMIILPLPCTSSEAVSKLGLECIQLLVKN